jgi:hypothetical protein
VVTFHMPDGACHVVRESELEKLLDITLDPGCREWPFPDFIWQKYPALSLIRDAASFEPRPNFTVLYLQLFAWGPANTTGLMGVGTSNPPRPGASAQWL